MMQANLVLCALFLVAYVASGKPLLMAGGILLFGVAFIGLVINDELKSPQG